MTVASFFGYALTAYGPAISIFFLYVAKNAQLVILTISRLDYIYIDFFGVIDVFHLPYYSLPILLCLSAKEPLSRD